MGAGFAADIPAVSIWEAATHFYAGETMSRTLRLESPPDATAPRKLNWWLMALNAPLAQGTIDDVIDAAWHQSVHKYYSADGYRDSNKNICHENRG